MQCIYAVHLSHSPDLMYILAYCSNCATDGNGHPQPHTGLWGHRGMLSESKLKRRQPESDQLPLRQCKVPGIIQATQLLHSCEQHHIAQLMVSSVLKNGAGGILHNNNQYCLLTLLNPKPFHITPISH